MVNDGRELEAETLSETRRRLQEDILPLEGGGDDLALQRTKRRFAENSMEDELQVNWLLTLLLDELEPFTGR